MGQTLIGKKAIVTGANQGLGLEIARAFVQQGADVMICARDGGLLYEAADQLKLSLNSDQIVASVCADISKCADVEKVMASTLSQLGGCNILVNNAGIYGPKGRLENVTFDEWKKTIEINLFGSVLMSRAVLPYFKNQSFGKIIQLAGGGAANPMPMISAYAASKAGIVRFSETLAEEVRGTGIDVNCIAPGALNTRMLEEVLEAGPENVGVDFYERSVKQKETGGAGYQKAVDLAIFLASDQSNGITAKFISALWDKWEEWPLHSKELSNTDVYTLRRIVGKDRDCEWGDR